MEKKGYKLLGNCATSVAEAAIAHRNQNIIKLKKRKECNGLCPCCVVDTSTGSERPEDIPNDQD